VRVQKVLPEGQILSFMEGVTCNAPFEQVIAQDFGKSSERARWIRALLDNRPTGASKEEDIASFDEGKSRESTLRVFKQRFDDLMPLIIEPVLGDPNIRSSFKGIWKGMPEASTQRRRPTSGDEVVSQED
jgi:hypothetical protein